MVHIGTIYHRLTLWGWIFRGQSRTRDDWFESNDSDGSGGRVVDVSQFYMEVTFVCLVV